MASKTAWVHVRCAEVDYQALKVLADIRGLSVSRLLRELILEELALARAEESRSQAPE